MIAVFRRTERVHKEESGNRSRYKSVSREGKKTCFVQMENVEETIEILKNNGKLKRRREII